YGGLVFVYMGPPGTEPLFPIYDVIDTSGRDDVVLRGMRLWGDYAVGMVKDCNWLQHYENIVDPWHLVMLHQTISGDQFKGALMARSYEERQRKPDDLEAQEGQRAIAMHALEHLGTSDTGIAMLRHLLREQIQRVEQGLDPINVVRDAGANRRIPTHAWNTV